MSTSARGRTWVLTYHSVSDGAAPLCVTAAAFGRQLDQLIDAGFEPVTLAQALQTPAAPARRFAVTFDDGYRDFAQAAWPQLRERNVPATLFAVASEQREHLAGGIGAALLEPDALRDLAAQGVTIGAHGIDHVDLTRLGDAALRRELALGRERLETWTDTTVDLLAYPFGAFDARVQREAGTCFRAAFSTQLAALPGRPDRLALPRIDACYLDDPALRAALRVGADPLYLFARRALRRLRGSEPRRPLARAGSARPASAPDEREPRLAPQTRYRS